MDCKFKFLFYICVCFLQLKAISQTTYNIDSELNLNENSILEFSNLEKEDEFPDAVTSRGLKHINELVSASKKKYKIFILFVIQRNDCKSFSIAKDIDQNYANALSKAVKKNLKILCYDCKFSSKGIKLNSKIKFKNK